MENPSENLTPATQSFAQKERDALYKTIFNRRDVRGQFNNTPIADETLTRILYASHHAPSVGFMQPWNFILIKSKEVKERIHKGFLEAHAEAEMQFEEAKRKTYRNLKLEGILESPINICITCDPKRTGKAVIGRTHIKTMDSYSTVCAVQNLWLAARAEGLGVGWVSIIKESVLKETLVLPDHVEPVAYLCIGHVDHFKDKPELESIGWLPRLPLDEIVSFEQWNGDGDTSDKNLLNSIRAHQAFPHEYTANDKNK
ncbi:MAG: 5,6-dimethylbenzimidazole synthase [Agarilytica sp.]